MPDITMCQDEDCPKKDFCHRYTATASIHQSYFLGTPRTDEGCEEYWDNGRDLKNEDKSKSKKE